jgi:hypothetical protein
MLDKSDSVALEGLLLSPRLAIIHEKCDGNFCSLSLLSSKRAVSS